MRRQDLSGFTLVQSIGQEAVDIRLPQNGQYHVHAAVWAIRLSTGESELAEFRGNGTSIDGVPTLVFVWTGADQTKTVRLVAEGQAGGVVNPVVLPSGAQLVRLADAVASTLELLAAFVRRRGRAAVRRIVMDALDLAKRSIEARPGEVSEVTNGPDYSPYPRVDPRCDVNVATACSRVVPVAHVRGDMLSGKGVARLRPYDTARRLGAEDQPAAPAFRDSGALDRGQPSRRDVRPADRVPKR